MKKNLINLEKRIGLLEKANEAMQKEPQTEENIKTLSEIKLMTSLLKLEYEKLEINEDVKSIRVDLKGLGVASKAVTTYVGYCKKDESASRRDIDDYYALCKRTDQLDMFPEYINDTIDMVKSILPKSEPMKKKTAVKKDKKMKTAKPQKTLTNTEAKKTKPKKNAATPTAEVTDIKSPEVNNAANVVAERLERARQQASQTAM